MARVVADCREMPSETNCDLAMAGSEDHLIEPTTLNDPATYWLTATAGSSARLYYETTRSGRFGPPERRVEVPTGVAIFPGELSRPPRKWVEALYDLRHWSVMPRGGHFAAMEQPKLFVDDVRSFFRRLR